MVSILKFQSDALFAVNSAFALWQLLRYRNTGAEKHVWLASMFCGFAALTRNDGLILFFIFILLILFVVNKNHLPLIKKLIAALVPFVLLVIGYLLVYALSTGIFYMGTSDRSWVAFVQGQYFIYGDDPDCEVNQLQCAVNRAEETYGTKEENNSSVFNAVLGNPQAYADRLERSLGKYPK